MLRWLSISLIALSLTQAPGVLAQEFEETLLDQHGYPLDDPRYVDIRRWFEEEELGTRLYRSEDYADAYPHLAEAARHGFKRAQHNIALMHINGQGVDKNPLIGVALLGLAAESGDRQLKKDYENGIKALPKKFHKLIREQTNYYIARYGMKAQGISCRKVKRPGSNMKDMRCIKQPGEYETWEWAP